MGVLLPIRIMNIILYKSDNLVRTSTSDEVMIIVVLFEDDSTMRDALLRAVKATNRLSARYRVSKVQPVDIFPHTHNVENIALLELN